MFSNKKILDLCKVIVVLLILIFCLIPYFRSNKLDNTIGNNEEIKQEGNVNNNESESVVGNDGGKEEQYVNDKDVDNTLNNDSTGKDNNNTGSDNEDKNTNSDVEISKDNNVSNKKITLVDKTNGDSCAQAIEYFYQDNQYRYYFTCIKSNSMYVIVNGVEYKLVYALENDIVTIGELESNGYRFLKESKNLQDR